LAHGRALRPGQHKKNMASRIINSMLRTVGLDPAKRRERRERIVEMTAEEQNILAVASRYSMTGQLRQWSLLQAMEHVARKGIEGDIVECGVWKGGNLILCGLMAKKLHLSKRIWGFDTFEGMSEPTAHDFTLDKAAAAITKWRERRKSGFTDWTYSPYEEVERNFRTEVGTADLRLVRGKVEDTLERPENIPGKIAILRLDTDWYESTRKELDVLYPRLQRGGVLIVDDYGHWAGAKKAVDEYFAGNPVWLHRIDYSARLHIKD
jgi:hypothetical protein